MIQDWLKQRTRLVASGMSLSKPGQAPLATIHPDRLISEKWHTNARVRVTAARWEIKYEGHPKNSWDGLHGTRLDEESSYACTLFRLQTPMPAKPAPNNSREAGSGTARLALKEVAVPAFGREMVTTCVSENGPTPPALPEALPENAGVVKGP